MEPVVLTLFLASSALLSSIQDFMVHDFDSLLSDTHYPYLVLYLVYKISVGHKTVKDYHVMQIAMKILLILMIFHSNGIQPVTMLTVMLFLMLILLVY